MCITLGHRRASFTISSKLNKEFLFHSYQHLLLIGLTSQPAELECGKKKTYRLHDKECFISGWIRAGSVSHQCYSLLSAKHPKVFWFIIMRIKRLVYFILVQYMTPTAMQTQGQYKGCYRTGRTMSTNIKPPRNFLPFYTIMVQLIEQVVSITEGCGKLSF